MKHDVRLAALIVNYDTGSYAVSCVESLLAEWQREGRERSQLTVVVVDNASPSDQGRHLARLEALGAHVLRAGENLGYARGMNRAYQRASRVLGDAAGGGAAAAGDVVAILNPDLHFLPGSVAGLVDYVLEHPECGSVDPRTCIDPLGVFNLPRNLLPTPLEHWRVTLAQLHPWFCRRYASHRLEKGLEWWRSSEPVETDMLSGCCLFMRRSVIDKELGGRPLDPRYPLYFEDTDLFRTLRAKGYTVVHHGGVRILHHWSRSAKVGGAFADEPTRRYEISKRAYYDKFYGPAGRLAVRSIDALARRWPQAWLGRPMIPLADLGELHDPVEIRLPHRCRFLLEIAVHPTFIICGGIFGEGERWVCPPEAWEWLFKLEYYVRGVDLERMRPLGGWRFTKVPHGREEALRPAELSAYGDRLLSLAAS